MGNIEHWPTDENDMVPGPAYDRMRADRDHWREETAKCKAHHEKSINKCRERLEGAVEAITAWAESLDDYASTHDGSPEMVHAVAVEMKALATDYGAVVETKG